MITEINEKGSKIVKNLVLKGWPNIGGNNAIRKKVLKRKKDKINKLFIIEKLFFIISLSSLLNKK